MVRRSRAGRESPSHVRYPLEGILRKPSIVVVSFLCSISANHQPQLSGTVVNQARRPARGITVSLVGLGLCDTVDSLGRFVLKSPAEPLKRSSNNVPAVLRAAGGRLSRLAALARGGRAQRDVLVVARDGEPQAAFGVRTDGGSLRVALDLEPVEIVSIAEAQLGRGPHQVGRGLECYPYNLGRFLGPGEAWCSEFVSWVYLVAGYPLGDTADGRWIIRSSRGLRRWFQRNARFIKRDDAYWDNADPSPGDYIRYDNRFGGHSGIVSHVSGTTLYTIEGNVNNRVVTRTIKNWRQRGDIDGFGLRSGAGFGAYVRDVSTDNFYRSHVLGWVPVGLLRSISRSLASADTLSHR
ncbi:MAG: CHAP domain-containing protein [Chitinivibrionales bacterium]|nr:CHAP domain-containing protein [Chitinivibrionales bacterium]